MPKKKEDITILVVDDYNTMRRMVINTLHRIGFENIIEADNGLAALDKIKAEKIDLVIADWNMPEMSGFELLQKIRGDEAIKKTPVLMVTAEAQVTNIVAAVKAGVNDYIVKPFNQVTLSEKVEKIIKSL